jgi:hypothetical protein
MPLNSRFFIKKAALIILSNRVINIISLLFSQKNPLNGWTLGPIIIIRSHEYCTPSMVNHELIHVRQFWETFGLFLVWYPIEYCWHRLWGASHVTSYARVSFEQEAYRNENNKNYLQERAWFAWFPLMKSKNKKPLKLWGKIVEV